MAERKKGKKRKEEFIAPGEEIIDKPTKDEFLIAKWMRKNVPIKKTKFLNHNVEYFTARRAVDALLESKWSQGDDALFKTREDIVDYLHIMLEHKFYHRARKVPVSESELKGGIKKKDKKNNDDNTSDNKENKEKSLKEKEKITDAESSVVEGNKEQQPEKEKRKKKIRLDMHNDQRFVDGLDAYVWIYDPIPFHYWIIGTLLVLGAIAVCLFPLWPPSVRLGVYYLSVAAAGFLVTIIILAVIRLIIFCLIWLFTFGKHHLWILPNLTEDVGFFASFWPLYTYEYRGNGGAPKKKDKKKKKDKDSDNEDEIKDNQKIEEIEQSEDNNDKQSEEIHPDTGGNNDGGVQQQQRGGNRNNQVESIGNSESESESSQRSSTGKDFEIVDQDELES